MLILSLVLFPLLVGIDKAHASDTLINGSFSSTGGGWSGANTDGSADNNNACSNGGPSLGVWTPNALVMSYSASYPVTQSVVISQPSSLALSHFIFFLALIPIWIFSTISSFISPTTACKFIGSC